MEKLFLEVPTIKRKEEALVYLDEFVKYNSELNGTGSMDNCLDGMTYEEWLLELEKRKDRDYLRSINRWPSKTFFVVRDNDDKIVGMINIRFDINDEIDNGASHIGYGIRPIERRKGYAKRALYLALLEEHKIGEDKVLLDCTVDNIGSNKTILALGGELWKTELDTLDDMMTNYYWINVNEALKKYEDEYRKYVIR